MKYLILTTGLIERSELAGLPSDNYAVQRINVAEENPLDLFSLLLSDVKLFTELMGDEQTAVTAIVRPEGVHTALLFDDEQTMTQAKLMVHGMGDTQWSTDTRLTHAVRFSTGFTESQWDEVVQLGTQLDKLMVEEQACRERPEILTDSLSGDGVNTSPTSTQIQTGLAEKVSARAAVTRRLIEIQAHFGICPCMG